MRPILRAGAVALVTGASSGIGEAVSRQLAERGCRVVCAARQRTTLEKVAGDLALPGHAIELDVNDLASVRTLLERLPAELREIDILINSAGHDVGGRIRFDEGEIEDWLQIVDTNLKGVMRLCHSVIRSMLPRDRGHVVNIGSLAGIRATKTEAAYVASKFGMRGFTEALRLDYRETGIRFTEVLPGAVRTQFAERRWTGDSRKAEAFYQSLPGLLTADDVARAVLFALEQPPHVHIPQINIEALGGVPPTGR